MRKVLFVGIPFIAWESIIKTLIQQGHKVHVIGWKDDKILWGNLDVIFIELDSLWNLDVKSYINSSSIKWSQKHSLEFLQLLAMYDRIESNLVSANFVTRESLSISELNKWHSYLTENKIDTVFMANIPHRIWDFAIYLSAKELNINSVMFALSPFQSNVFAYKSLREDPLHFIKKSYCINNDAINKLYQNVKGLSDNAIPSYMIKQKATNQSIFLLIIKKYIDKLSRFNRSRIKEVLRPNTYRWVKKRDYEYVAPSWLKFIIDGLFKYVFLKRLKSKYKSVAVKLLPKEDFYFFALHYQPEETTIPSALSYHNQFSLIEYIYSTLPKNVKLVVKEHPSQFYYSMEGDRGRDLNYYKRIEKIGDRIHIQSIETNSFDIIKKAKGVFTICGTIGLESAIAEKKVFTFGRIWYKGLKNVYHINDFSLIDFFKVNSLDFSDSDWTNFSDTIKDYLISCKPYKAHLKNTDLSDEISTKNLLKFIQNEILN
jgi:hypothetical protein